MINSIKFFLNELELYEDIHSSCHYKKNITQAIFNFLHQNNDHNAYRVYEAFFKAYWIGIQHPTNPFLRLPEILKKFEKHAGKLIDKQRDHYIHSVNVFILGLSIYANNKKYRGYFDRYAVDSNDYPDHYCTRHEEFFYRWGLASLSHDIAYPLEITLKQANKYFAFIWDYSNKKVGARKKSFIEFPDFDEFVSLPLLQPSKKHRRAFDSKYPHFKSAYAFNAVELLAHSLSPKVGLRKKTLKAAIQSFVDHMKTDGFIDHGFYGAIIMLRWYHCLLTTTEWNPAYFYFPILDAASAVLLHNFYKYVLMKKPFNLQSLSAARHPIAFLLILCDELQEWNRKSYGEVAAEHVCAKRTKLSFLSDRLKLTHIGAGSKEKILFKSRVVNVREIFRKGVAVFKK